MALYMKQDFTPPILSRRWLAMKFRPNMLLYSRQHVISILESGLLFREDSIEVEQEAPAPEALWKVAGGGPSGWFTRGEKIASLVTVAVCLAAFPPRRLQRTTLLQLAAYMCVPVGVRAWHRLACRGTLRALLALMREYLALARRAAACLRECAALRAELGSVSSVVESTHTMLCRQQSELAVVMCRASSALLGNAPWLRADLAWDAVDRDNTDNLLKIHHAFLVVQSTLLKHIAMAHYIPSAHAQRIYKNHNERIYWIHSVLIPHLLEDFKQNYDTLERMYRLLKNCGNFDTNKKPGSAIIDSWVYSDVHSGIARANLELKLALNKCNNLDMFLDSCALNNQEIDLDILNRDIDGLIENITKCLTTAQASQIRLKKLQNKFVTTDKEVDELEYVDDSKDILKIEDKDPETIDEVFYFVKTEEDDNVVQPIGDISTGPGKKEREQTKIVLNELKRKLVNREDLMRERERQALVKTMPELKNIPDFPRQIKLEEVLIRKGYISKIPKNTPKKKLHKNYRISHKANKPKYKLNTNKYTKESDLGVALYSTDTKLNSNNNLLSFSKDNKKMVVTKWLKKAIGPLTKNNMDSNEKPDVVNNKTNKVSNKESSDARNYRFSKKDLELTPSSSSDSDFELYEQKRMAILKDARKHRAARKKSYSDKRANSESNTLDESLRPIEYSFGAGMAMASVLQVNNAARRAELASEEVFAGDGQLSQDSGNDEDA